MLAGNGCQTGLKQSRSVQLFFHRIQETLKTNKPTDGPSLKIEGANKSVNRVPKNGKLVVKEIV